MLTYNLIIKAILHIKLTNNNIIVCCTDHCVNVLSWSTAGERGFRGTKKATPFAIQITMLQKLSLANIKTIEVEIYGMENNRDVVLKTLHSSSLTITCVRDVTPKPHNGCRSPKLRRI